MGGVPAGALRVLVVDDNADARRSLCQLLTLLGYAVQEADGGRAALSAAARGLPDAALIDLSMPGLDGYEVARRLREMPGAGRVLLAAVTGDTDEAALERGLEAGFDVHLLKPVDLPMLEQLLRNHALTRAD
jgi:CheY-like chemotaxis protein